MTWISTVICASPTVKSSQLVFSCRDHLSIPQLKSCGTLKADKNIVCHFRKKWSHHPKITLVPYTHFVPKSYSL